jgi:Xaa-Pro aminopeptidase
MFESYIYQKRRQNIKKSFQDGILLFLGNGSVPINYPDNCYRFRQDSTFLYYFGIDRPNIAAVIDIDNNEEMVFGDEPSINDVIWSGDAISLKECSEQSGIKKTKPYQELFKYIQDSLSKNRKIHFLTQYRYKNRILIEKLLGIKAEFVNNYASVDFIRAVVNARLEKTNCEIDEIKKAIKISEGMYEIAFESAKEGVCESEILAKVEGYAISKGVWLSFPTILTIRGDIFHNNRHNNILKEGKFLVMDSGVETKMHYASDITRTIPVNRRFSAVQKDIYRVVLKAQLDAIGMLKEGVYFLDAHIKAAKAISDGLKGLGFLKGSVDGIVESGAYALFFPHGLGHPMGLDVHDMEGLGEDYVGYDNNIKRSSQFGLSSLRFARKLKENYVTTVEPGVYFIQKLIEQWEIMGKFKDFIDYDAAKSMVGFGGVRIEDDVLIKKDGCEVLSKNIIKTVEDIEV